MIRSFPLILVLTLGPAFGSDAEVLLLRGNLGDGIGPLPEPTYAAIFTYLPVEQEAYFSYTPIYCSECPQANEDSPQPESPLVGTASLTIGSAIDVPVNLLFAVEQNDANALTIHYLTPAESPSPLKVQFDLTLEKQLANGNWFFNEDCLACDLAAGVSNVEATITSFQAVPEPGSTILALLAALAWNKRGAIARYRKKGGRTF